MKTKLEVMAIRRIGQLSSEAQDLVMKHHENMGDYAMRNSGCGQLNDKLREIEELVGALGNEA